MQSWPRALGLWAGWGRRARMGQRSEVRIVTRFAFCAQYTVIYKKIKSIA